MLPPPLFSLRFLLLCVVGGGVGDRKDLEESMEREENEEREGVT